MSGNAGRPPRLALFGNIANNLHQMARALRSHSEFEVRLYLDDRDNLVTMPESDDPSLVNNYPSWMRKTRYLTPRAYLAPWSAPIVGALRNSDLVIVSGDGPVFAQFAGRPWCFFVTGGDLTVTPFPLRFWRQHRHARLRIRSLIVAAWQRRAIHHATQIWSQPFRPFTTALTRLGVEQKRVTTSYFPIMLDVNVFRPPAIGSLSPEVTRIRATHDFLLFHPSRLMIQERPELVDSGQWKRNDLLIRAFASFVRVSGAQRPALVMLDRTDSPDVAIAKEICRKQGIERNVVWLRPPRSAGFTRNELREYYAIADVVADDFGAGWFGAVVIEAMAMEKPVVTYVDETAMERLYPWHPMLSVGTEDGVARTLLDLYASAGYRHEVGIKGRQWVELFHSYEGAAPRYVRNIRDLLEQLGGSGAIRAGGNDPDLPDAIRH